MQKLKENKIAVMFIIIVLIIGAFTYVYLKKSDGALKMPKMIENKVTPIEVGTSTPITGLYGILGNLSYGLKEPKTKLTNGIFIGKFANCGSNICPPNQTFYSHMKLEDRITTGDLNGDNKADAVVIIGSLTNTSPTVNNTEKFTSEVIAVMVKDSDTYKNVAAIELTDDLKAKSTSIKSLTVRDGVIYAVVEKNNNSEDPAFPQTVQNVELRLDATSPNGFRLKL